MTADEALHAQARHDVALLASQKRTICEVLREMRDLSVAIADETLRAELQARIVDAYVMAKKMDRKLREYKFDWDADFWEANVNWHEDLMRRKAHGTEEAK